MRHVTIGFAVAVLGSACAAPQSSSQSSAPESGAMRVVDPLAGVWSPSRIGAMTIRPAAEARVFFNSGVAYATQAGCGNFGGTYRLEGARILTRQHDPMNTSKCESPSDASLEIALADFMAKASSYALSPDGGLRITASDGRTMDLRRTPAAIPALDGRWDVERIGSEVIAPGRRVRVRFREDWVSAHAECNQMSSKVVSTASGFSIPDAVSTQMGCAPAQEAFDGRLFAAVSQSQRYTALPDGRVRLEGGREALVLRRPPAVSPSLAGAYSACGSNLWGVLHDGVPGLTFTGSTVRDSAGCGGTYRADGALLEIRRDGSKACAAPPAPLDVKAELEIGDRSSLLARLQPDAFAFNEEGVLRLRTRRGVLDLCREGGPRPFGSG